jgi:hypothetical protein
MSLVCDIDDADAAAVVVGARFDMLAALATDTLDSSAMAVSVRGVAIFMCSSKGESPPLKEECLRRLDRCVRRRRRLIKFRSHNASADAATAMAGGHRDAWWRGRDNATVMNSSKTLSQHLCPQCVWRVAVARHLLRRCAVAERSCAECLMRDRKLFCRAASA